MRWLAFSNFAFIQTANSPEQGSVRQLQLVAVLALCAISTSVPAEDAPAILVPPGFHVEHFADDDLAHDIHSMTIDGSGRVVVSGPGYIHVLLDKDKDGRADDFIRFADGPKSGAQGMCFLGPHLLCSGDDGLQIFHDRDADGQADGPPTTFLKLKAGFEHQAHSIQRGPDGWWYIIAGNMTEISAAYATLPTSPINNPQGGVLMRLNPDLTGCEILADGLRNAYDFAFGLSGDVFTCDSDGERDVSLPWYQPCRLFHLTSKSNAGWISRSWKRPDDFPDMAPVPASFGRGSPTGVACYRHTNFPSRYDGALFVLDWTFGRIMAVSMEEHRGLWKASTAEFAKASGHFGFAPTDIEVGTDGSLFVSVGGRGTRGSVYRIVHDANTAPDMTTLPVGETDEEKIDYVLKAPQPLSSWSRARWEPIAMQLGAAAFVNVATDEGRRAVERIRAIEILTDTFKGLDPNTASQLTTARSIPVRARTAWALGRAKPESPDSAAIFTLLNDSEPLVVRFALETLACARDSRLFDKCLPRLAVTLNSPDVSVRSATSRLMSALSPEQQESLALLTISSVRSQVWMAMGQVEKSTEVNLKAARTAMQTFADRSVEVDRKFEAIRLLQLSLGDVGPQENLPGMFEGYTARANLKVYEAKFHPVRDLLAAEFPSGSAAYDRELIRTIAMLGSSDQILMTRLLDGITNDSAPADDIHRLTALTQVTAKRTAQQSERTSRALVDLESKMIRMKLKQDSNWDDRLTELYDALVQLDGNLPMAIANDHGLGLPGHVLWLKHVPAKALPKAISGFARFAQADPDYQWSNDVVLLLGRIPSEEHRPLIREQFDNPSVRDAVLSILTKSPRVEDRALLLAGLDSTRISTVQSCVSSLIKLPRQNGAAEQYQLLRAAERLNRNELELKIREDCIRLLQNNLVQSFGFQFGKEGYRPQPEPLQKWADYLKTRFTDYPPPMPGGETAQKVLSALDTVNWDAGDADRGAAVFAKLSCAKCHGGRKALGPDLDGVARRFSRFDLFASIVDPDRDVSDRYQLTTVETRAGKVYSGLVVYESVDGLILRDADQKNYRIEAEEIATKTRRRVSLMPAGLLRNVADQDLADLDAYLRRL